MRVLAPGSGRHLREGVTPFLGDQRIRLLRVKETPKGFLVDLEGVSSREEAEALRDRELTLDISELDPLDRDEYYFEDLVGLAAMDEAGERLGEVSEVLESPAHETLVIENPAGDDLLVPFVAEQVLRVDLAAGTVLVRLVRE